MRIFTLVLVSLLALLVFVACDATEEKGAAQLQPTATTASVDASEADPVTPVVDEEAAPCYPDGPETDEIEEPFADSDLALQQVRLYDSDLPPSISLYNTEGVGYYRWFTRREVAEETQMPLDNLHELRNLGFLGYSHDDQGWAFKMDEPAPGVNWAPIPASLDIDIFFFTSSACARDYAKSEYAGWKELEPSLTAPESVAGEFYWREQGEDWYLGSGGPQTTTNVALVLEHVVPGAVIIEMTTRFGPWQIQAKWDPEVAYGPPERIEAMKNFDPDIVDTQSLAEALARSYEQTLGIILE